MSEFTADERERLIEALGFPRLLMEQEIKRRACPHHHRFNAQAEDCHDCLYILECQGYGEQLSVQRLRLATRLELERLLEFGFEYVTHQLKRQDHDTAQCSCEQCTWIRKVSPLLESV